MPIPQYNSNIPLGISVISDTQQPIENNFSGISTLLAVNHTPFNTDPVGLHNLVTLYQQAADPVTGSSQMALYSKASTDGNISEIFYRYPSNGRVVQLSGTNINDGSGGTYASPTGQTGWQYLSGGLLMKWGLTTLGNGNPSPTNTYIFPVATQIPVYNNTPVHIEVAPANSAGGDPNASRVGMVYAALVDARSFTVTTIGYAPAPINLYWMTIGV